MYAQKEKSKENRSRAVANSVNQNKNDRKQGFGFVDNRPKTIVQKMKVRGTDTNSVLSGATNTKHVEPTATQATRARDEYGSRTFVPSANNITSVVDANAHDFTEANGERSERFNFTANVDGVSVYMKTPPNLGAGQPVNQTVDDATTSCEIGVVKNGEDQLQVTHFKTA